VELREIEKEDFFQCLNYEKIPDRDNYLIMYSSFLKGYVKDPELMLVPVDDHMVHRGDGVFDVMRCVDGNIYQMEAHLRRLEDSARAIDLKLPPEYSEIRSIIKELVKIAGVRDCLIRVILSRGPGSFSIDPFDCPYPYLYVIVTRYKMPPKGYYVDGVKAITTRIPMKHPFFAKIKSCNYLPNVLIKMEAKRQGCEFAIAIDEAGFILEGPTENVGVVGEDRVLRFPKLNRTLPGITVQRLYELSERLIKANIINDRRFEDIHIEDAYRAREIFLCGTSIEIIPVIDMDDRIIGSGKPGEVFRVLNDALFNDMKGNPSLLTEVF